MLLCIGYDLPFFTLVNEKCIALKESNYHKLQTTEANHVQVAEELMGWLIGVETFHVVLISLNFPMVGMSPYSCKKDARCDKLSLLHSGQVFKSQ